VVQELEKWEGRPCCDLAISSHCKQRCQQVKSESSLSKSCEAGLENHLFSCLKKQKGGEKCCQQAESYSCKLVCQSYYISNSTNRRENKNILFKHCHGNDEKVFHCVQRQIRSPRASNPAEKIPCCDRGTTPECQERCRAILQTSATEDGIIEEVIKGCGKPDVRAPLWQCFLATPPGKRNETPLVTGLDSAKLQCCAKAKTSRCRDLCTWTYNLDWVQHSSEFYQSCSYIQPVSVLEASMHSCLTDVEEPCQLGCKGLDFCSNFNHRPTQLFRSCNSQADKAARDAVKEWENGLISLPQMTIPVRDIRQCKPDVWKAIACALQIKPCLKKPSPLSLCMEDCIYILNECVDKSRLTEDKTVPQLCNALPSRTEDGACISVSKYLSKSADIGRENEVTSPCNPDPCGKGEVCRVRRRKCKHSEDCKPYICKAGCVLGQVSTFLVPRGAYVRIPEKQTGSQSKKQCFKACHCSHRNKIENCKQLPCFDDKQCVIGPGHRKESGSHFNIDSSLCVCHDGDMICSKNTCKPQMGASTSAISDMPGNCPAHYRPVCASNGKTYPNHCLAKCAGFKDNDLQKGSCSSIDPCINNICGTGNRCVARRQVCLSLQPGEFCNQFECVSESTTCNPHYHDSVCDTTGEEFTNACILFSHERTLAYRGHCMLGCSNQGEVCGHNGETYSSQCAALADRTTIDYPGKCRALGNITAGRSHCTNVRCQPLKPNNCKGLLPPGGCCPVCAAELQALFDPRQVQSAAKVMDEGPITVRVILDELSNHLTVAECDIYGYLSIEGGLVIIITTVVQEPTDLQLEACNSEAQRLEHLIRTGSPLLQSYLTLTPLLVAPIRKASLNSVNNPNSAVNIESTPILFLLTIILHISKTHWFS
ncbi:reversion-inducing cysteine-rich protein with Kazal motifs, partial [Patella vulgata]|uniref:reversion-inducing cysteine-rich protein with Kazal motifs n=1 Tax=Patella vulgata TaxID=6465 RepID=UPI00217F72C4